jgi:hypothetical protein
MIDDDSSPAQNIITRTLTITYVEMWTLTIGYESTGPADEASAAWIDPSEQSAQQPSQREET